MSGNIFILNDNNELVALKESKYENEDLFQTLIEKYPQILAGDQINPDNPRKWIFVSREMGVPSQQDGSAQWFLDHLFIDQDGTPTFVEVKRSTDTRIRREVVAQMLDYAANATQYWPIDSIIEAFKKNKNHYGNSLSDIDIEEEKEELFWQNVSSNLRSGKIRLLFVADEIPISLQRIIEFLNEQMTYTEVLGIEIKQFISDTNFKTLVPRVIGRTASAVQTKRIEKGSWDEQSFLADVQRTNGEEAVNVCQRLLRRFESLGCRIWWGQGSIHGSFYPVYDSKESHTLVGVYPWGKNTLIELQFQKFKHPFNTDEKLHDIKDRLEKIPGVSIQESRLHKRPNFNASLLKSDEAMDAFISIFAEYIDEVKNL